MIHTILNALLHPISTWRVWRGNVAWRKAWAALGEDRRQQSRNEFGVTCAKLEKMFRACGRGEVRPKTPPPPRDEHEAFPGEAPPITERTYFVLRNAGGAVFVKHGPYFAEQGGTYLRWGKNWKRVEADSIDQAREIGERTLP